MYQRILEICKRRGITYPSFEIYGGLSGFYDYGPVGSRIKQNIENLIRDFYVIDEGCMEVQCPVLSPQDVWIASGHVENFTDKLTECVKCGEPYRADHLVEEKVGEGCDHMSISELNENINDLGIKCPKCGGKLDRVYDYNLMFKTYVGPGKYKVSSYLRPETAQSTYISFKRLWDVGRKRLPLGAIQIGHSFRNEISPRKGMVRLREFNQAEVQFFVDPEVKETSRFGEVSSIEVGLRDRADSEYKSTLGQLLDDGVIKIQLIAYLLGKSLNLFRSMGMDPALLRLRQHKDDERAFYSTDTWDIEYMSPSLGRIELVGVSDRTDYDLTQHMKLSGENMQVTQDGKKFTPHVIEAAYGIDRSFYCVIESCFREEGDRNFFSLPPDIAPYRVAVFPLVRKDGIPEKAREVYNLLREKRIMAFYDRAGSIGKRYARADEIGILYCITVDYDTLKDDTVTIRYRDSKKQERISIEDIISRI